MRKVIAALMVKNEAKNIARTLNAVLPLADHIVVSDTGSTDDTCKVIVDLCNQAGVAASFFNDKWVDFAHNRNLLLEHTRSIDNAWVLVTDADIVWHGNLDGLDESVEGYNVLIRDGGPEYHYPLLLRNDVPWRYEGVTHEYVTGGTVGHIDSLWAEHKCDGGNRATKYQTDRELLEEAVKRNPKDSRSVFYLANTYRDMGLKNEAIELYQDRIQLAGWPEEVYYSLLQLAKLTKEIHFFYTAHTYRPDRPEAVCAIVKYLNSQGRHHEAYHIGIQYLGKKSSDILWVDRWIESVALPVEVEYARRNL